jgi:hypothetical protein
MELADGSFSRLGVYMFLGAGSSAKESCEKYIHWYGRCEDEIIRLV